MPAWGARLRYLHTPVVFDPWTAVVLGPLVKWWHENAKSVPGVERILEGGLATVSGTGGPAAEGSRKEHEDHPGGRST